MNISLIVGSCDQYEFIWGKFFTLFDKYWDHSIPINKYFFTENNPANHPGFIPLTMCGKWTTRLKLAIDKIDTDYILWLQDDYFLRRTVSLDKILDYMKYIEQNNIDRFGIHENSNLYSYSWIENTGYYKLNQNSLYTISMQASIWKKSFLQTCFNQQQEETIWQFEVDGSQRINSKKHNIVFDPQHPTWYHEALRKGQYTQNYYTICQEEGL